MMQGLNLNKLIGILLRFRQRPVTLMADTGAMLHQVQANPIHCSALQFLWWQEDQMAKPFIFHMTTHLFGGVWNPLCAGYALQQTFDGYGKELHGEVKSARYEFYVDGLLLSVGSLGKATSNIIMPQVKVRKDLHVDADTFVVVC